MAANHLLQEFPPVSTQSWEEIVRKDLKGADYAKKLVWQTTEGLAVKPYYRAEDLAGMEYLDTAPGSSARDHRSDVGCHRRRRFDLRRTVR
jgi:methylmalonyl-CoA mutase